MSNNASTTNQLSTVLTNIVLGISFTSFIPGVIGLIFNVLVFTRPKLRHEPCAIYFFSATCSDLFIVFVVLPVRILSNGFRISLANYNNGICKFENFSFNMMRVISCWLIALACVDRFFNSSPNIRIRRLSSVKIARVVIGITIIAMIILYCHLLVYYNVVITVNSSGNTVSSCTSQNTIYNTFFGIWHMVFYSLCPSFLMILFGSLTLSNIRRYRQVVPMIGGNNRVGRRTDAQLLRMLAAQVLVIILSTLPFSVWRFYFLFGGNIVKSSFQQTQESIASAVISTIPYFAHTSSFYLYTLTGTVFRKEFIKIIGYCVPHNQNVIRIFYTRGNQITDLQTNRQVTSNRNIPVQE